MVTDHPKSKVGVLVLAASLFSSVTLASLATAWAQDRHASSSSSSGSSSSRSSSSGSRSSSNSGSSSSRSSSSRSSSSGSRSSSNSGSSSNRSSSTSQSSSGGSNRRSGEGNRNDRYRGADERNRDNAQNRRSGDINRGAVERRDPTRAAATTSPATGSSLSGNRDRDRNRDGNRDRNRDGNRDRDRDGDHDRGGHHRHHDHDARWFRYNQYRTHLVYRFARAYLYSNYGDYRYSSNAYERGYQDGLYTGANDADRYQDYNPERSHFYHEAGSGFLSIFGGRDSYRMAYRDGFLRGYNEGYEHFDYYFRDGSFQR